MSDTPTPTPQPVSNRYHTTPFSFRNSHGELLQGVVMSRSAAALPAPGGPPQRCALICHGMLMGSGELFYPALSEAILDSCTHLPHVVRFDFSGHAASEGAFLYGGYRKLASEVHTAVSTLAQRGLCVTHLIGHSLGANAALLFASQYSHVPNVIAITARGDMSIDDRFDKTQLLALIRDGVMEWRVQEHVLPITLETFRDRLSLDTSGVRNITARTLIVHGTTDEIIPFRDAERLHHWMTAKSDLIGDTMDPRAAESVCKVASIDQPLTRDSFQPSIINADRPHTLVALPDVNHLFTTSQGFDALAKTVCFWIGSEAPADDSDLTPRPTPVDVYDPAAYPHNTVSGNVSRVQKQS